MRLLWNELASYEGKNRKKWNAFLKLVDLAMETAMLRQLLATGSPAYLTYSYATFLAINSLSCAANILLDQFSALTEVFIDSIFDFSAAVLFPIVALVYSYYNFDFDRAVYLTFLEVLPPGSFERLARTFANPSDIALFRVNFDSLRISSGLDFVLRISMNMAFCYRFKRVVEALIWTRHREYASGLIQRDASQPAQQKPVPKGVATVFLAFSLVVLLCTHKAISDSKAVCSAHPECVVYAHKWKISGEFCPCLILIDVNLSPKTYKEWIDPVDAYPKVKALAASGMLTSLQVINRHLLEWPEELRLCRGLKTVQLIHTNSQSLPVWTKEFKHLETLQIEGKNDDKNLLDLPEDLFSDMPHLTLVHFGIQSNLERIPPFTGVPRLQTLALAWVMRLREIPTFDRVPNLSHIILAVLPALEQIPDMSPLQTVIEFVVYRPSALCCNGFVGTCDLSHSSCRGNLVLKTPAVTCLKNSTDLNLTGTPFLGSTATQDAFKNFAPFVCQESGVDKAVFLDFPTKENVEVCENKPFRQCRALDNSIGICYNTRFQVIMCLTDDSYITLRRVQIEKGIGPKCDPIEEQWLGCASFERTTMRAVYKGELVDGIRQGKGELVFANGDKYEGEFRQGFRHGHGVFTSKHGARVYDGEWRRGEQHGVGKERWLANGDRYEGEYQHDVFHGKGVQTRGSSKNKYDGEFQNGRRHGYGRMEFNGATIANSDTAALKKIIGAAVASTSSQHVSRGLAFYVGTWKDGRMHGEGKYTRADGSFYEGAWRDGLAHGFGKELVMATSEVYEGTWHAGLRHGDGTITRKGNRRKGVWEMGQRIKWTTAEVPLPKN
ncbi:hypothetical protein PHYBOEH_006001 [Phytophthora boehmeriae]|uniref:WLGC domain-containing protein n=1 Tax=Phytophthora boehmeriae TaxID=109152 RepID=A0A8T1WN50_9STRA|nr:hypothetical protein PHYBOEH_006001 [Phytophthora boehmeriae]